MEHLKDSPLRNKKVLVVDDEPDILESIVELLPMCEIVTVSTFSEAWELLGTHYYDFVILDIMGVDGYRLLNLAKERNLTAIMLTAHALSPEDVKKSYEKGAALYIPKEEMVNIDTYLMDVLEAKEQKKSTWWRWLNRFDSFFQRKFETKWDAFDKNYFDQL